MSVEKVWWYARGQNKFGPHTSSELKALAASGQIVASDMIWKEGLANWLPASSVKGLIPGSLSATAPPPLPAVNVAQPGTVPPPVGSSQPPPKKMGIFTKVVLWIGGIFLGLIVLDAIVGTDEKKDGSSRSSATGSAPAEKESQPSVRVGEAFTTPTFEIQIRTAQARSSVGNIMFASQPSDGAIYVAIQWSYKNISQKPVSSFRSPSVHLLSPDGTRYDADLGASASYATELDLDAKVFSDLNPGIRVVDANVFEVSREMFDPTTWKILVDADRDVQVQFAVAEKKAPAQTSRSEVPALPNSIPPQFQGRWALAGQCNIFTEFGVPPDPGAEITGSAVSRYEHYCTLKSVSKADARVFSGVFTCAAEGEQSQEAIALTLSTTNQLSYEGASGLVKCV